MARSFFSLELCFPLHDARACHDQLRGLMGKLLSAETPRGKWQLFKSAAHIMSTHLDRAYMGCWEYFDDGQADPMYEDWLQPMKDKSRQPKARTSEGASYFTFTMMLQPQRNSVIPAVFLQCSLQYLPKAP